MQSASEAVVYIVDDDNAGRESLRYLLDSAGLSTRGFSNPEEFLRRLDPDALGCIILDMRMPRIGGLDVLYKLQSREVTTPVIMISAFAGVREAVAAMRDGAADFFAKPFNDQMLLDSVQTCIRDHRDIRLVEYQRSEITSRVELLTDRERQVLDSILEGKRNKQIATDMNINLKTVEGHRARLMEKMQAGSVADLARNGIVAQLSLDRGNCTPSLRTRPREKTTA